MSKGSGHATQVANPIFVALIMAAAGGALVKALELAAGHTVCMSPS